MAWNEPGGNRNDKDPWGGNRGGDQGPPDLDEALKKGMDKLNSLFGGKSSGGSGSGGSGGGGAALGGVMFIIVAVLLVVLGYNSLYTVDEQEQAVVLRFGKYHDTVGSGLHFKLPFIDDKYTVNVTKVRSATTRAHMLTEDENIVEVNLTVQYQVKDARAFLLSIRDAERALDYATDSALRHEVGSSEMHSVLTEGRSVLGIDVRQRLQKYLDFYQSGLLISKVNIESTQPPKEVQEAFRDVQRAIEDEQRVKNEAEAYKNRIVPESRGKAQRMIEEATAYKEEVIARAQGEADRFTNLLAAYEVAPEVTRERLYLETLEKVMANSGKVLVDVEGGNNMMYLPLDRIGGAAQSGALSGMPQNPVAREEISEIADRVVDELRARQNSSSSRRGRQ